MADVSTLQQVELGVLGPLQVRQYGLPVTIPGAKPRAILTMLGLHGGSVVSADTLVELLWGDDPPRTAAKALQTHISSLRRTLGDGFVLTEGTGWTLSTTEIDASRYKLAAKLGRDAVAAGDTSQAVARFDEALTLWRGTPELPDGPRGTSEKTRWIEGHAALVEDRADALLATGRAAEIIGELEAAVADAPLRERRWGQLMLALYRAGRQGEALGAYQRARSLLADELGVDPGPDLRRLEAAIVAQDAALEMPVSQQLSAVTRAVTFLLTDIEGSTAAWEADADAMAVALARHDEIVEQVVTSRGGRLIKTRGEGDATFSVFDRPSAAAAAAIELQEAIAHEPWALRSPCASAWHCTPARSSFATATTSVGRSTAPPACGRWRPVARSCARVRQPNSSSTHFPTTLCWSTSGCASCKTSRARSTCSSSAWRPPTIPALPQPKRQSSGPNCPPC